MTYEEISRWTSYETFAYQRNDLRLRTPTTCSLDELVPLFVARRPDNINQAWEAKEREFAKVMG